MEHYVNTPQFSAVPVQPWYEKREMVEAARAYGYEATEALLDDWIKKGLVGRAERAGLGRGSVAWWSSAQFTLFVECLKARQQGKPPDWPIMCFSSLEMGLLERAWRRGTSSSQACHGGLGCFRQEHDHRA